MYVKQASGVRVTRKTEEVHKLNKKLSVLIKYTTLKRCVKHRISWFFCKLSSLCYAKKYQLGCKIIFASL